MILYDLLLLIYGLVTLPVLAAKKKLREGFRERRGHLPSGAAERLRGKKVLWVHAVSVGEARLALRLIERFRRRSPGSAVVLTTTTASSQKIAREAEREDLVVTFCPFDLSWMTRRFIRSVRPSAIVILETEVWPNLLRLAEADAVPVLIVNGRISDRAYPVYRRWLGWVRPSFARITRCLAQSEEHARRFRDLGVPADRVRVTGNMKFDLQEPSPAEEIVRALTVFRADSKSVLLAASTHPGEEELLLDAYRAMRAHVPDLKLAVAPRHLERLAAVEEMIRLRGLKCAKISDLERRYAENVEVLLVDVWGVLNQVYSLVDAVFVGGSLVPVGGHNLAEPAVAGRPVLYGPWMQNFRDMEEEFRSAGAGVPVADARELERRAIELFQDPSLRRQLAEKSRSVVTANAGATEHNLEEILTWCSKK